MKSVRLIETSGKLGFSEADIPRPTPSDGELLIRVCAAGVTPTEVIWYPTTHTENGEKRINAIPAHEFSGEVAALGPAVSDLREGQAVYGMNDWFADGALAEYCITRPEWVAPNLYISQEI